MASGDENEQSVAHFSARFAVHSPISTRNMTGGDIFDDSLDPGAGASASLLGDCQVVKEPAHAERSPSEIRERRATKATAIKFVAAFVFLRRLLGELIYVFNPPSKFSRKRTRTDPNAEVDPGA